MPKARIHHPLRLRRTTHEHAAYGEELSEPEFETNRMKFTGHERDPETNLDYMMARYYSSNFGRFLQVDPGYDYDPMDPMSWNLYGYVRGNPVMGTDPTGMQVYLFGNTEAIMNDFVKEMGGEFADKLSLGDDGKLEFNVTKDEVKGNKNAETLLELTTRDEKLGMYLGTDGEKAASFFTPGSVFSNDSRGLARRFEGFWPGKRGEKWDTWMETGGGYHVGTVGRSLEPKGDFFAFIALNENATIIQSRHSLPGQETGNGKPVSSFAFFLHETVENLEFMRQMEHLGYINYGAAHHGSRMYEIIPGTQY